MPSPQLSTLNQALIEVGRQRPGAPAWTQVGDGPTASRGQWLGQIDAAAQWLDSRGMGEGALVAYAGDNHWVVWTLAMAAWRVGADFWPVNYRWTPVEYGRALDMLGREPDVVIGGGEELGRYGTEEGGWEQERLAALWREAGSQERSRDEGGEGRLIMTTGGTTGWPKFVALDQAQLAHGARMFREMTGLGEDDRVLVCAPNYHVAGFAALTTAAVGAGAELVIAPTFEPPAILETIEEMEVTCTVMVPTMWHDLMVQADSEACALGGVRFGICGGAPMPPGLVDRAQSLGFELVQGYGLTEAGPMVTLQRPGHGNLSREQRRRGSGVAPPSIEVRILDEDRRELSDGEVGEIAVRGPNIIEDYEAADGGDGRFFEGWLLTGDCGYVDQEGHLFVLGRLDDRIITGGENVEPAEVEAALMEVQGVDQAVVFGVDHPRWGQQVTAMVTPRSGSLPPSPKKIRRLLRDRLAGYKIPRQLKVVDAIPRTAAGKISRDQAREAWIEADS